MQSIYIGFILGLRQIQRANRGMTLLVITIMMFTFLNLVAISGILIGLPAGVEKDITENLYADLVLTPPTNEYKIRNTPEIVREIEAYPEVTNVSVRYKSEALIEAGHKEYRDHTEKPETSFVKVMGILPSAEDQTTNLSDLMVEGEYLSDQDEGKILIGSSYVKRHAVQFDKLIDNFEDLKPGDDIFLTANGVSKEFEVKGIVKSKVNNISLNTYVSEREFRHLFGRADLDAEEVVIKLVDDSYSEPVQARLLSHYGQNTKVETDEEASPGFLWDIKVTFDILSLFIGSIGLVIASITIFIVIFINALSRRRHIGILKGIGIEDTAIKIAYVTQAAFYCLAGAIPGFLITYLVIVPYFAAKPFDFPLSDGILVADPIETLMKFLTIFTVALIAGLVPAWMIVRKDTLNSILGRN